MSGTSLVILAMYTTVNVTGPGNMRISPEGLENILTLMIIAGCLTIVALVTEGRRLPDRSKAAQAHVATRRTFNGPRQRRL